MVFIKGLLSFAMGFVSNFVFGGVLEAFGGVIIDFNYKGI